MNNETRLTELRISGGDSGASLLMVLFAIVFVSAAVTVLLSTIDGGLRQGFQLDSNQSNRLGTSGALQTAISQVYRGEFPGANGSPTCPTRGGALTYSDPTVGPVAVTCYIKSLGNGGKPDGSDHLDLGQDALILTDTTDATGSLQFDNPPASGWGWLVFDGSTRINSKSSGDSIWFNPKSVGACTPFATVAGKCSQIVVGGGGALWGVGACINTQTNDSTGIYANGGVNCNNMYNGSPGHFDTQITTIINKENAGASSELPFPSTVSVANKSNILATATCAAGSGSAPPTMTLTPGYFGGAIGTADLNTATSGGYGVKSGGCVSSGKGATTINTIILSPGVYYFRLTSAWIIGSGVSVVGGVPTLLTDPTNVSTTDYYACDATKSGTELVFAAATAGKTVNGVENSGVMTLCGMTNPSYVAGSATTGPSTVALRGLWSGDNPVSIDLSPTATPATITNVVGDGTTITYTTTASNGLAVGDDVTVSGVISTPPGTFNLQNQVVTAVNLKSFTFTIANPNQSTYQTGGTVFGAQLWTQNVCTPTAASGGAGACALLNSNIKTGYTGSFNVTGFTFAPNDSFALAISPDCGTTTEWARLDCEANPTVGNGGIASFNLGLVLDGMYAFAPGNKTVTGDNAAGLWDGVPWVPVSSLPASAGSADIVFFATGTSSVTGSFSGSAEGLFSVYPTSGSSFESVTVTGWHNW